MATNRAVQAIVITKDQPAITNRAAQAVVITQDPPTAMIRNVRGYALTTPPATTQIRNVRGYALSAAPKPPPVAQTGINAMLWLLNQNINISTPFTLTKISIGSPSAYSDPSGRTNAKVLVSALNNSGYTGSMTAYYNRRTIDSVFSSTAWLLGTISSATTIRALIPQINTAYGVGLDPTDVVDGPVAAGATSLALTAAPGSYMFQPGSMLTLPTKSLSAATPIVALPGFANAAGVGPGTQITQLLMHFDGTGSAALTDVVTGQVATVVGTAGPSTSQSKFGGSSLNCPGAGSYLTYPDLAALQFSGDFTIDCWIYPTNTSSVQYIIGKGSIGVLEIYAGAIYVINAAGTIVANGSGLVANTWQHVAVVKKGSTWTIYINGNSVASATNTGTLGTNAGTWLFGQQIINSTAYPYVGNIDELRFCNSARWTSNFTPPAIAATID